MAGGIGRGRSGVPGSVRRHQGGRDAAAGLRQSTFGKPSWYTTSRNGSDTAHHASAGRHDHKRQVGLCDGRTDVRGGSEPATRAGPLFAARRCCLRGKVGQQRRKTRFRNGRLPGVDEADGLLLEVYPTPVCPPAANTAANGSPSRPSPTTEIAATRHLAPCCRISGVCVRRVGAELVP